MSLPKSTASQIVARALTGQEHFEAGDLGAKDPAVVQLFQNFSTAISTYLTNEYAELKLAILAAVNQAYSQGIVDPHLSANNLAEKMAKFALSKAQSLEALEKPKDKAEFLFNEAHRSGLFGKQTSTGSKASTDQPTSSRKFGKSI